MKRLLLCFVLFAAPVFADEYQVTVGLTAVQVSGSQANRTSITIRAHSGNTGIVYCGSDSASISTGTGFQLSSNTAYTWDAPGESTRGEKWCIADTAAQVVSVQRSIQ